MNRTIRYGRPGFMAALAMLVGAGGCTWHYPHSLVLPPGSVSRTHAEPMEGGYYRNWDPYAATIEVKPANDLNPVMTQHVLIASVRDENDCPLPNRRVEWIISEGSVGDFVEVDESGWRASRGHKVTNKFAITHTNNFDHVLTRGTDDPSDDIHLGRGDTWAVITSPVEGTTHVVAYAPGIYDWDRHKVFVTKHWQDVEWMWPPDATNPVGSPHVLTTTVRKHSDGTPLEDYIVNYAIVGGPGATFEPDGGTTVSLRTDAQGMATVTLNQDKPLEGVNDIAIDIIRPADQQCCKPAAHIATGQVTKTWVGPEIAIQKDATPRAMVDEVFDYTIVVTNPSDVDAHDVIVADVLPDGIEYVSSSPQAQVAGQRMAWSLGTLGARGTQRIDVKVKGPRSGQFTNCAEVEAAMNLSDRDCADTVIVKAALTLEKRCPAEVTVCDVIPYTIVVRNPGDGAATNVTINDELPEGLETEDGKTRLRFDAGMLEPGEAKKAEFNVRAKRSGEYVNTAAATADGGLTADGSCTTIVRQPALEVTKTGPELRYVGRPVEYEITVTNTGDTPARETVLVDAVPTGATVVDASDRGVVADGQVTWNLGTLAPGQVRKVTLTVKATERGTLRNTASARAVCAEATADAQTTVKGIPAILLEVIDLEDPIEVGENEIYEIIVTNQGSADGTNIVITATIPPEMSYVSADGPTRAGVEGKIVTFAPLPTLAPKAKATYRVTTRGEEVQDVRFKISLTSDQIDRPVEETESTHVY